MDFIEIFDILTYVIAISPKIYELLRQYPIAEDTVAVQSYLVGTVLVVALLVPGTSTVLDFNSSLAATVRIMSV